MAPPFVGAILACFGPQNQRPFSACLPPPQKGCLRPGPAGVLTLVRRRKWRLPESASSAHPGVATRGIVGSHSIQRSAQRCQGVRNQPSSAWPWATQGLPITVHRKAGDLRRPCSAPLILCRCLRLTLHPHLRPGPTFDPPPPRAVPKHAIFLNLSPGPPCHHPCGRPNTRAPLFPHPTPHSSPMHWSPRTSPLGRP